MEANGCPEIFDRITVEWNGRFTRRMGDATYGTYRIRLSSPLWPRASVDEQENTVAHEVCHIVAVHLYGWGAKGHGADWRGCMVRAGFNPTRCHNVDRAGLARKNTRTMVRVYCGCPDGLTITKNLWTRTLRNGEWVNGTNIRRFCRKCRQNLRTKP
ncbi:MAG: SprT family zinc-dependent metalloprotease [Planctomycetota bacterium]